MRTSSSSSNSLCSQLASLFRNAQNINRKKRQHTFWLRKNRKPAWPPLQRNRGLEQAGLFKYTHHRERERERDWKTKTLIIWIFAACTHSIINPFFRFPKSKPREFIYKYSYGREKQVNNVCESLSLSLSLSKALSVIRILFLLMKRGTPFGIFTTNLSLRGSAYYLAVK